MVSLVLVQLYYSTSYYTTLVTWRIYVFTVGKISCRSIMTTSHMSSVSECGQSKRPAKNTDVCMFYTFICTRVTFILDMIIVFNKIINNSCPPAWCFSLTRTGNKEFIIVGLYKQQ